MPRLAPGESGAGQGADELVDALEERCGVRLEPGLAELAMTHRSFANEHGGLPTNERLEFLGDSVLGLAVTDRLYRDHPGAPEGRLADWRAAVVSSVALAEVGRTLGLGALVLLGRGEDGSGGRDKDSILADAVEALIGAIYLQHGLDVATRTVEGWVQPRLASVTVPGFTGDWKTTLSEHVAARPERSLTYAVSTSGPDHAKQFEVAALVDGTELGRGHGRTKKQAQQDAARMACQALGLAGATG